MNRDSEEGRQDCIDGVPSEMGRRKAYYDAYAKQYELEAKGDAHSEHS